MREPRPVHEVGVGPLRAGVGVRLEEGVERIVVERGHDLGEVVGGVGDPGVFPPEEPLDDKVAGLVLGDEHLVTADPAERRHRREAPPADLFEVVLPLLEQPRGDTPGRSGPVEVGQPARPVGLGVVGHRPGLVEERRVEVVHGGEGATQAGREPRPRLERLEGHRTTGEVGVDRGAAPFGQCDPALDDRDGLKQPAGEQVGERRGLLELSRGGGGAGAPDDPATVLGVLDEGDVVA